MGRDTEGCGKREEEGQKVTDIKKTRERHKREGKIEVML